MREILDAKIYLKIRRACGQTRPALSDHEMEAATIDENGRDDDDLLLRLEGGTSGP
jgi:hypothetical protein